MNDEKMMTSVKNAKELVLKEMDTLVNAGTLNKETLCLLKESVEVLEKINHIERGEDPDMGSSYKNYYIRSWDYPSNEWDPNHYGNSFGDRMGTNSYMRGRDPQTGRYMSRDNMAAGNRMSYGGNNDNVIYNLEMAMGEAATEQERMEIQQMINRLKSNKRM